MDFLFVCYFIVVVVFRGSVCLFVYCFVFVSIVCVVVCLFVYCCWSFVVVLLCKPLRMYQGGVYVPCPYTHAM